MGYSGKEESKKNRYEDVDFTDEQLELFKHIAVYKPKQIDLETVLKPLIPDYIPSVGWVDPFIKPPAPPFMTKQSAEDNDSGNEQSDGEAEVAPILGLTVLDEPGATQSNASILQMQLKAHSKQCMRTEIRVDSIERAERNPKRIESWISSIELLHRTQPAADVEYSQPMPAIDRLMQVWPPPLEALLNRTQLPTAEIDASVEDYSQIVCSLMDIPVHQDRGLIQSLHVLFTLWMAFRNNQHFKNMISTSHFAEDDFRPSTADAVAAVQRMESERPGTSGLRPMHSDARPDTAAALRAIHQLEGARPDTAAALRAVAAMEQRDAEAAGKQVDYRPDTAAAIRAVAELEAAAEAATQSEGKTSSK